MGFTRYSKEIEPRIQTKGKTFDQFVKVRKTKSLLSVSQLVYVI